jgi:hypothetical protein
VAICLRREAGLWMAPPHCSPRLLETSSQRQRFFLPPILADGSLSVSEWTTGPSSPRISDASVGLQNRASSIILAGRICWEPSSFHFDSLDRPGIGILELGRVLVY